MNEHVEAIMDGKELPESEAAGLTEELAEQSRASGTAIPVVAVGASAGGLDVFRRLLGDFPADTGFAIVFVQHLDPNHHSMLAEILGRATPMPVSESADGMPLEANHVFVIPANVDLTIANGALKLAPRAQPPGLHMPIDRFLRSVADHCGNRAISVILSGTGADGAAGVEAIKAAGGVTFAQDAATAKFATMPQAAVATGCVDFVLPPEGIAGELVRIARHPYMNGPPAQQERTPADEEHFGGILAILHGATGIDFSLYREKMIKRRILRRLALRNINSLAEYSKRLENDSVELMALQRDLLISVTSFFRDHEAFDCLKKLVFPRIVRGGMRTRRFASGWRVAPPEKKLTRLPFVAGIPRAKPALPFPVQIFASDLSDRPSKRPAPASIRRTFPQTSPGTPEPLFHQDRRRLPDQQEPARDVCLYPAQSDRRSAIFEARLDQLPQRADLSGNHSEEHHSDVPLRAQTNRVSLFGRIRRRGGRRSVFRVGCRE